MVFIDIVLIVAFSTLAVCVIAFCICMYMLYRNNWVANHRRRILNKNMLDMTEYESLLSYDEMFNKFWVWDIEKLKKNYKSR